MSVFFANFPYIVRGAGITVMLSVCAILFGSLLGIAIALVQLLAPGTLRAVLRVWVACIRGVPVLVLMFFLYFGLPALNVGSGGFLTVSLALIIYLSAFYSEVFRGAIEAVPRGQREAGLALGMSRVGVIRDVLLPQSLPLMTAPWLNISVIGVKSTAYASIVGLWELTMASREVVQRTLAPFQVFFGAMLLYFVICYPLSRLARHLEPGSRVETA